MANQDIESRFVRSLTTYAGVGMQRRRILDEAILAAHPGLASHLEMKLKN